MPDSSPARRVREADQRVVWHPFTAMRAWCDPAHEPLLIERGEGAWLIDTEGNRYLDGNSSIWTNIHGHNHPALNRALRDQSEKIAHSSFLGFSNTPAVELAEKLVAITPAALQRVFYSDDGSTAIEVAVRQALHYHEYVSAEKRDLIVSFDQAYHGDTLGAASLCGISVFHETARRTGYRAQTVRSLEELQALPSATAMETAAVIIEPLIQGAAGMKLWPSGMLRELRNWCDRNGALLILDEVMTGFGRTGTMFACQHESVEPDFLCLAKGLTGGYLPLAATMTTEKIFRAFWNEADGSGPDRTFYYGHSYCGNPLACAVALENLRLFDQGLADALPEKVTAFASALSQLENHPNIREIRRCGLVAGIEICAERHPLRKFPPADKTGAAICLSARKHGLLTRPVLDTIILMLPLICGPEEFQIALRALESAIDEVCC